MVGRRSLGGIPDLDSWRKISTGKAGARSFTQSRPGGISLTRWRMQIAAVTLEFRARAGTPDASTQGDHKRQRNPVSQCPAGFALFSSIAARGADGPPDALGRGWQFDMLDAELGERIDDRVRDRRQPRRDPALAAAAHAERVCR